MPYRKVRFSASLFRKMWLDPETPCAAIRARFDCAQEYLTARAQEMGLPSREHQRVARLDGPELVDMWLAGVVVKDICAHFDCTRSGLSDAINRLGLAKRPSGGGGEFMLPLERYRQGIRIDSPEFRSMWAAGVSLPEMAAFFGISGRAVERVAVRFGLRRRAKGRGPRITVAEWQSQQAEDRLREAMAASAKVERKALRLAEMVDVVMSPAGVAAVQAARAKRELGRAA